VMTAEPLAAPGRAPSDHQPTRRGFEGGIRAPSLARMPTTRAETPRLGTDTRIGFAGLAGAELVVFEGFAVFLDRGEVAFDAGSVGTAVVVLGRAVGVLGADGLLLSCR
jgi:hypothetical protein